MTALDQALKLVEAGYKVFPIESLGKKPLVKWGSEASNDDAKITEWAKRFPECNWGLPTGWVNDIVVIDLDTPEALHWAKNIAKLPLGLVVSTPRGGEHWYYMTTNADIQTNQKKLYEGVDIRGTGGFVVVPGSETSFLTDPAYGDGVYEVIEGDILNIPPLPEVILEMLPRIQKFESVKPTTAQVEVASDYEQKELDIVVETLQNLPRPWFAGAMWDNTVFAMACRLSRMVNSPEYALTEDMAVTILLTESPTDDAWTADDVLRKWESAKKSTVGQYAKSPGSFPPPLLDLNDTLNSLGAKSDPLLEKFWNYKTKQGLKRYVESLRGAELTIAETRTVVYHLPFNNDPKISFWKLIEEVYNSEPLDDFIIELPTTPAKAEREASPDGTESIELLERWEKDIADNTPNFIAQYMRVVKKRFKRPNLPLHYLNAWLALSCVYGNHGQVLYKGSKTLNLWALHMAETASGKGDAKDLFFEIVNGATSEKVSIGGDATSEALTRTLLGRDGAVSLFWNDEAHGEMAKWKDNRGFNSNLMTRLTNYYDGKVEAPLRQGQDRDLAGQSADITFNMSMIGTWEGITSVLTEKEIGSGFIGRFLPAIGFGRQVSRDSILKQKTDRGYIEVGDPLVLALSDQLSANRVTSMVYVDFSPEVNDRITDATEKLYQSVQEYRRGRDLQGIFLRTDRAVWNCAALLAISEGRSEIIMTDVYIALRSMEHWAKNIIDVAEAVVSNDWRKNVVDRVYKAIQSNSKGISESQLHRAVSELRGFEVKESIDRLVIEGYIEQDKETDKWVALS